MIVDTVIPVWYDCIQTLIDVRVSSDTFLQFMIILAVPDKDLNYVINSEKDSQWSYEWT